MTIKQRIYLAMEILYRYRETTSKCEKDMFVRLHKIASRRYFKRDVFPLTLCGSKIDTELLALFRTNEQEFIKQRAQENGYFDWQDFNFFKED